MAVIIKFTYSDRYERLMHFEVMSAELAIQNRNDNMTPKDFTIHCGKTVSDGLCTIYEMGSLLSQKCSQTKPRRERTQSGLNSNAVIFVPNNDKECELEMKICALMREIAVLKQQKSIVQSECTHKIGTVNHKSNPYRTTPVIDSQRQVRIPKELNKWILANIIEDIFDCYYYLTVLNAMQLMQRRSFMQRYYNI